MSSKRPLTLPTRLAVVAIAVATTAGCVEFDTTPECQPRVVNGENVGTACLDGRGCLVLRDVDGSVEYTNCHNRYEFPDGGTYMTGG